MMSATADVIVREINIETLVGQMVVDAEGARAGRVEEILVATRGTDFVIVELHLGTAAVLGELAARGASMCELGIPYSDPIADGPVIQASYTRALGRKVKLAQILDTLAGVAPKLSTPIVTMVSYAIVLRHGLARYVEDAQRAGACGAIVPDLPVEEAPELAKICQAAGFSLVQLVTPTTPRLGPMPTS